MIEEKELLQASIDDLRAELTVSVVVGEWVDTVDMKTDDHGNCLRSILLYLFDDHVGQNFDFQRCAKLRQYWKLWKQTDNQDLAVIVFMMGCGGGSVGVSPAPVS